MYQDAIANMAYYTRRAHDERQMAAASAERNVAQLHLRMADEYESQSGQR